MEEIFLWTNGNTVKRKSLQEIDTISNVKKLTEEIKMN